MSWWGIGTTVGSAIHKSIDAKEAAKKAADEQRTAAQIARDDSAFKPFDVSGAFGTANIDQSTGEAGLTLTPQMQDIQRQYQEQAGQFAGQGQTALGALATQGGQDFLQQGLETDPYAMAESQFSKLDAILNPSRQRQREALEGRLLRQGRLGSTGGSLQQQGFESAIEESKQKGLLDAFGQAQAVQQQQLDTGTRLGLLGQQQQDVGFQQSQARLGGLAGIDQQALQYLNLGGSLGGRQSTAGAQQGAFGMQGAAAGTAATLGAAAGRNQAIGKAASALGDYFGNSSTNNYQSAQIGNDGSTSESLLASDDQNFYA